MIWTDDAVAALRRVAREGGSFGDVAELLGCTRSTVAGKANRLGVSFAGHDAPTAKARHAAGCKLAWDRLDPVAKQRRLEATTYRTPQHQKRRGAVSS